jgi:CHAT domain-containing protein
VPYLYSQATKAVVKEKLKIENNDIDILHFSCHGKFDKNHPLKSHIVLAPQETSSAVKEIDGEKWNLTAEEIFGLEMNASLVTLSACESGINDLRPGDELIGLTRSLIYAGTPSVIVSLWAVEDLSTSLVMQYFYQELRKPVKNDENRKVMKVEALQRAQQYVRNLTAQEVIDYCDGYLTKSSEPVNHARSIPLQLAKAYSQTSAYDLKSAIATYENILSKLTESEKVVNKKYFDDISRKVERLKFLEEKTRYKRPVNYNKRLFDYIYHWAPFILVGDWK